MTIRVLFFWSRSGVATEPRLGYCRLVFGSNASNHGRQKKNKIIFLMMIPVLGPDLKTRKDLEVYTHLMTAFSKISFFYISRQEHFSLVETQHFSLFIFSMLNCCLLPSLLSPNGNNCNCQL